MGTPLGSEWWPAGRDDEETHLGNGACRGAITIFVGAAQADFVLDPEGDPNEGNSWSQRWQLNSHSEFDYLYTVMLSPDETFEHEALSDFSDGSWAMIKESYDPQYPVYAWASGDRTNALLWNQKFEGDLTKFTDVEYKIAAFRSIQWFGHTWLVPVGVARIEYILSLPKSLSGQDERNRDSHSATFSPLTRAAPTP